MDLKLSLELKFIKWLERIRVDNDHDLALNIRFRLDFFHIEFYNIEIQIGSNVNLYLCAFYVACTTPQNCICCRFQ